MAKGKKRSSTVAAQISGGKRKDASLQPAIEPKKKYTKPRRTPQNPIEKAADTENTEYVVEEIIGMQWSGGEYKYEVKWAAPHNDTTWEPIHHLAGCSSKVREYKDKRAAEDEQWKKDRKEKAVAKEKERRQQKEDQRKAQKEKEADVEVAADAENSEPEIVEREAGTSIQSARVFCGVCHRNFGHLPSEGR